jgi:peptidoglycan/LPS O-acetylase OafA/YrhL
MTAAVLERAESVAGSGPRQEMSSHLPVLDGIRGLAIIFVMCAHGGRFLPGQDTTVGHALVVLLNLGWCGVQLFFVLSGFLITRLLLAKKESGRRQGLFADFYTRRALRIFPLYYVALAILFLARHAASIDVGPVSRADAFWYLFYVQNWWNAAGHIPEAVGHFWSLAIEEQFYFVWPMLVIGIMRRSLARICLGIVVAVIALRLVAAFAIGASSLWLYHATVAQVEGLAMGALLATFAADGSLSANARRAGTAMVVGILALVALILASRTTAMFGVNTPFSVAASVAFSLTFTGAILYLLDRPDSLAGRAMQHRGLRAAGRISYGLYVIHYPVSWALARPSIREFFGPTVILAYVGISIALAMLSWHFLERPFLALKDRFGRRSELAPAVGAPSSVRL